MNMKSRYLLGLGLFVLVFTLLWFGNKPIVPPNTPVKAEVAATNDIPPQTVEDTIPDVQTERVVSNADGSVIARGSASFTAAPLSTSPPPAMLSESEARKLSSPPIK